MLLTFGSFYGAEDRRDPTIVSTWGNAGFFGTLVFANPNRQDELHAVPGQASQASC